MPADENRRTTERQDEHCNSLAAQSKNRSGHGWQVEGKEAKVSSDDTLAAWWEKNGGLRRGMRLVLLSLRPFSWKEIAAKFDKLAAGHATEKSREKIKNAVRSLEDIQVSDLTKMLSELKG
jgi:hypothetical protein